MKIRWEPHLLKIKLLVLLIFEEIILLDVSGHFLGNGSIIDILRKNGHNVSHVHPDAKLPRYGFKQFK